jgi:hypothetical protein
MEAVFSAWSVQSGYKEELVEFRETSLPGYEPGTRGIELSRVFGSGSYRITAKKELGCEKKTSSVIEVTVRLL